MKKLRRPLLWVSLLVYPAAVVSLLVALAGAVMWVRSYYVAERWGWGTVSPDGKDTRLNDVSFWSAQGGVGMFWEEYWNLRTGNQSWPAYHLTDAMAMYPYIAISAKGIPQTRWTLGGFGFCRKSLERENFAMLIDGWRYHIVDRQVSTSMVVPWWSICAVGAVLPVLAVRRLVMGRRWRRRNRAGYCVVCGYDLRATPGRCPECGAVVKSA